MWLRPSIVGRPPPAAEQVSGAWMGSSVFTVGGCGRTGCHSAVHQHGQSAVFAVPELCSCTSSGRAWRLRAARDAQGERPGHWSSTATEPAAVAHLGAAYKELVSIVQVSQP